MRNSFKVLSFIAIVAGASTLYAWSWLKMGFAESARYTEQDKKEYDFYTPDILKNIPRISTRYEFHYANISGPASLVHAIHFYDTSDASEINRYLKASGYKKQPTCIVEADCWQKQDPNEVITVGTFSDLHMVLVAVNEYSLPVEMESPQLRANAKGSSTPTQ
ncbi:hypothetical protein [Erwinia sp. CGal63]|uniref:hypothetical protein n=1 Tax=Erwinia sp. CGal63 TaxID=2919889 RepID=UPI00300B8F49